MTELQGKIIYTHWQYELYLLNGFKNWHVVAHVLGISMDSLIAELVRLDEWVEYG